MSVLSGVINYIPTGHFEILDINQNEISPSKGKKRRLDHLTWEEKLQRKKLKNRVAAQTSRDRKKAKIDQMEKTIEELFKKNDKLIAECNDLKQLNYKLMNENASLRKELQAECRNCGQSGFVGFEAQKGSAESHPLPQGLKQKHPTKALSPQILMTALWKTVLACLLYQTCSTSSTMTLTLNPWSNSPKASYKISPQTWKQLLKKQIMKNQLLFKNTKSTKQWWGRHQKMWNPVDVKA